MVLRTQEIRKSRHGNHYALNKMEGFFFPVLSILTKFPNVYVKENTKQLSALPLPPPLPLPHTHAHMRTHTFTEAGEHMEGRGGINDQHFNIEKQRNLNDNTHLFVLSGL